MPDDAFYLGLIAVSVLGLVFGSFASALIYRIPRSIPWVFSKDKNGNKPVEASRSACPVCQTQLKFLDLFPFFSWLFLKGRCRYCAVKISPVYPLAELSCMLGFVVVYIAVGLSLETALLYLIVPFLVALLFIDIEHFILPNQLVAIIAGLGVLHFALNLVMGGISFGDLSAHVAGAVIYGLLAWGLGAFMSFVLKKDALGFGDVKFFAVAGLWLGIAKLPLFLILAGVGGVVFALIWRFCKGSAVFPFGPALIFSFFAALLYDGSHFF